MMTNKTVIITGANSGLGKQTALELAQMGGTIIMACRNLISAKTARGHTNIMYIQIAFKFVSLKNSKGEI